MAWGLVAILAGVLTVGAGVGLHYNPGAIQVGNTTLSSHPNWWRVGYLEFRRPRSGVVFAQVVHLGPVTVAFLPPQPAGPKASSRSGTGRCS